MPPRGNKPRQGSGEVAPRMPDRRAQGLSGAVMNARPVPAEDVLGLETQQGARRPERSQNGMDT